MSSSEINYIPQDAPNGVPAAQLEILGYAKSSESLFIFEAPGEEFPFIPVTIRPTFISKGRYGDKVEVGRPIKASPEEGIPGLDAESRQLNEYAESVTKSNGASLEVSFNHEIPEERKIDVLQACIEELQRLSTTQGMLEADKESSISHIDAHGDQRIAAEPSLRAANEPWSDEADLYHLSNKLDKLFPINSFTVTNEGREYPYQSLIVRDATMDTTDPNGMTEISLKVPPYMQGAEANAQKYNDLSGVKSMKLFLPRRPSIQLDERGLEQIDTSVEYARAAAGLVVRLSDLVEPPKQGS